ncbi:MAG TPA: glycosyltransferase family protein, partial [Methylocella sp.]|nr:glycosyltransferase family protein [Methylocella sp.]
MPPRTVAIIQARMTSTRLPGKVLKEICGKPMLARQIERVARARLVDLVAVATSEDASDDPIAALCAELGIPSYRGSLADVLGRFQGASERLGPADHIVRLTGDCPLTDPAIVDACVAVHIANSADYTANGVERTYPDGLDVEVMTASALARAAREAKDPFQREHVTPHIYRNPEIFSLDA